MSAHGPSLARRQHRGEDAEPQVDALDADVERLSKRFREAVRPLYTAAPTQFQAGIAEVAHRIAELV